MSNLLRLRILRHRQTPIYLKRVNAHAIRREPSTMFLIDLFEIWRIPEYKNQSGRSVLCPYVCRYVTISCLFLGVRHIHLYTSVVADEVQGYHL